MTLEQSRKATSYQPQWKRWLARLGPFAALLILSAFTATQSERFLAPENILNILRQNAPIGILALGMTFVIIHGGIDLSVGSLLALAGGVGIWTTNTLLDASTIVQLAAQGDSFNPDSAFRVAMANLSLRIGIADQLTWAIAFGFATTVTMGVVGGFINGMLVTYGRLAPFIATLGTMAIFRSLAVSMVAAGEFSVSGSAMNAYRIPGADGISFPWYHIREGVPLQLHYPVLVLFALTAILWLVLRRTRYGRYVIAVGCNEQAARYSAISVSRIKLATYGLMGLLTGIAALLQASRFNSVSSSSSGTLYELDAIAAVVIGGTSMRGGSGTILGSLVGVLLLGVISNMLVLLDISPYLQGLVKGVILIAAALLQRGQARD